MTVRHTPVISSYIHTIGYDADRKELHVAFKGSGSYVYHGVSPEQHQALMAADSKGKHLNKFIVGKHKSMRKP